MLNLSRKMTLVDRYELLKPVADCYALLEHGDVAFKVIKYNKFLTLLGVAFSLIDGYEGTYYNVFVKNLFVCDCSWTLTMANTAIFSNDPDFERESSADEVKKAFKQLSDRIVNLEDLPRCMADKTIGYCDWSLWNDGQEAMWRRLNTACTYLVLGEYDYAERDLISLSRLDLPLLENEIDKGKFLLKLLQNKDYLAIEHTLLKWQNEVVDTLGLRKLLEKCNVINW